MNVHELDKVIRRGREVDRYIREAQEKRPPKRTYFDDARHGWITREGAFIEVPLPPSQPWPKSKLFTDAENRRFALTQALLVGFAVFMAIMAIVVVSL